jgi:vacuolar-type H+-ATPase subunit I/STV1
MLLTREQRFEPELVARLDAVDGRVGAVEQRLRAAETLAVQVQQTAAEAAQRDADLGARIDSLAERLASLGETIERLPPPEQTAALAEAAGELKAALRAASERASALEREFAARLADVQAAVNDLWRALADRTQELERRLQQQVAAFDERARALVALTEQVERLRVELGGLLDELRVRVEGLEQAQSALDARITGLDQNIATLGEVRARNLGLLLAATEIAAAATDGRPYGDALALLRRAAGDAPELREVIPALERFADDGIPTLTEVVARFEQLATAIQEESKQAPADLLAETRRNLASLISIRRRDEPPTGTEAAMAAARQHLARGDVEAASQALAPLAEAGHAAAGEWREWVQARQQALAALDRLAAFSRQHLAAATGH